MSLPRPLKNTQPGWADLAIFAGVLGFLAYSAQAFVLGHSRAPAKPPAAEEKAASAALDSAFRAPASQAGAQAGSTEVLRLPCLNEAARAFSSQARLLQIHAPLCKGDERNEAGWRARNESSGEEILVFVNRKEKTLSTSYFSLKDGANKIIFTQELGKGKTREQALEVSAERKAN